MPGATTIDPSEAAHFGRLAADWWDPKGSSAMLHRLNPVRLAYIRARLDRHWGLNERARRPLEGRRVADVTGCSLTLIFCRPSRASALHRAGLASAPRRARGNRSRRAASVAGRLTIN